MKTFVLVSGDFIKYGGMDRANYALAAHLADRGDEVHLVTHRAASDLAGRANVVLHRVPKPLGSYLLGLPLLGRAGRAWAARIARAGGRVVVNGGCCAWPDVNWVHHVHAADAPRPGGGPWRRLKNRVDYRVYLAQERAAIRQARVIVTGCERSRSDVLEHVGGVRPEAVHAVYYGVDAALFRPADDAERAAIRAALGWPVDRPKVAFIGALGDRRKGFDTLFAAWAELCRDPGWDADLVVVGRGAEAPAWQGRAADAGLADRIAFLGFVRDLPELLRACDAHCLPSRYEGYSLVTQEALACGLPAFVTATAGIAERYPEGLRHLLLSDPDDPAELVARLRHWRDRMPDQRAAVAPLSQAVRAQTWDRMAEQVARIAESGVETGRSQPEDQ